MHVQSSAMQSRPSTTWETGCRLAAIIVALWWGGLNCLTGCLLAPPSAAANESHCSTSAESDCCLSQAGSEDDAAVAAIGSPSTARQPSSCCSLEAFSAEVKRQLRDMDGATAVQVSSRINYAPQGMPSADIPERWARLPDRGGTHLLHCVFLI